LRSVMLMPNNYEKVQLMGISITLLIVGFVAAVTLGSIAWYNSKRPPGWEDAEKPDVVPDLTLEQKEWPNESHQSDTTSQGRAVRD
jgi:hypothetical protein